LQIYDASASEPERTFLIQKDISFMNEYWPDRTANATPKYYAMWDQDTHYIAPTPNVALSTELAYTYKPDGLSSTQTSTWLSQNDSKRAFIWLYFTSTWILERSSRYDTIL